MFSYAVGSATSGLLKLKGAAANIYKAHSMFGNVGYEAMVLTISAGAVILITILETYIPDFSGKYPVFPASQPIKARIVITAI